MKARALTLLILCYVSLDFSSPFIPGAFTFDPDGSIEGVFSRRDGAAWRVVPDARSPSPTSRAGTVTRPTGTITPVPRRSRAASEWLVDVRRAHAPVPEARTPSEDH